MVINLYMEFEDPQGKKINFINDAEMEKMVDEKRKNS